MKIRLALALLLSVLGTRAENWPQWRGPTAQGISKERGLPLAWSAESNVVWKVAIPGEGWSSPIVRSDRIFLTTATDNGQSLRVISAHRDDGRILWDKEVFTQTPRRKEARNSYATPTPATDGARVYAVFGDGSFVAMTYSGEIVWTNRNYQFYSQHGLGASPILHEGLLIMSMDGSNEGEDKKLGWQTPWDKSYVVALDTKTGKEKWKTSRQMSRISHGSPVIWGSLGGDYVISEAGDVLQMFHAKRGELVWTSEVLGEGKAPSMVIGDGVAFTAGGWGGKETIKAWNLAAHFRGKLGETNLVWEQKKGMPKVPSMIYLSPHLYAITDGGIATCMNGKTGEIVWQERVGGNFSASPVAADGKIYFLADDGTMTVIEAGKEFKVLAKNSLGVGEKLQASPALSQGSIYIRTAQNLYRIGKK